MQGIKHLLRVGAVELKHYVAEGGGAGFDLDQGPEAVVAVDHPHQAIAAAHKRHRLAAEVGAAFTGIFGTEIAQPAAHLGKSYAELGRA
jgi:hypothetical protein